VTVSVFATAADRVRAGVAVDRVISTAAVQHVVVAVAVIESAPDPPVAFSTSLRSNHFRQRRHRWPLHRATMSAPRARLE